jgi:hypothetical protein
MSSSAETVTENAVPMVAPAIDRTLLVRAKPKIGGTDLQPVMVILVRERLWIVSVVSPLASIVIDV